MFKELKNKVFAGNLKLVEYKLVIFTWGNLSCIDRERKVVAIKPSGVKYEEMQPEDIVIVDKENGKVIDGCLKPSSDLLTHLEIYSRFEGVNSIVHTHSLYATSFAQALKPIECLGTTHADHFRGTIPIIESLTSKKITSDYEKNIGLSIVDSFDKNDIDPQEVPGCLVAHHGPFVWADSIENSLYNAVVLEQLAWMNLNTYLLNTKLKPIDSALLDKHFLRKYGKDAYYGQN